jgi:hypothetical protein
MRASMLHPLVALLLLAACSKGGSNGSASSSGSTSGGSLAAMYADAPKNAGATGSAEVTWQPAVKLVEQKDGLDALISVSTDGSTFVFDQTRGKIPPLKEGDVLVIKGLLARKVIASEITGNQLAVLTIPATLTEVISNGKIRLDAPIRFGNPHTAATVTQPGYFERFSSALVPPLYALGPAEIRGQKAEKDAYGNMASAPFKGLKSGWKVTFESTPADGKLNFKLQANRDAQAGVAAVITAEGYLADFDFSSAIDVEQSKVTQFELGYKKVNGAVDFGYAVQTVKDGSLRGNARMKLPATIQIPLYQYLGGLPLYLEISTAILIKPGIGSQYNFAKGKYRITYDGYEHFKRRGEVLEQPDSKVDGNAEVSESDAGSGEPIGIVLAFAIPRIELNLGVSKIFEADSLSSKVAYADAAFDFLVKKTFGADALAKFKSSPMGQFSGKNIVDAAMGSNAAAYFELVTTSGQSHSGSMVLSPCTRLDLHLSADVGVTAKALGVTMADEQTNVFKKDFTRINPESNKMCAGL